MKVHNFKPVVIFSVFQGDDRGFFDEANHKSVLLALRRNNIPFVELEGCYKGREELSVLLPAAYLENASVIATFHNQQSLLLLDNERGATLSDLKTGEKRFIGFWIPVTKESALAEESWTRKDGHYYIVSDTRLNGHFQR